MQNHGAQNNKSLSLANRLKEQMEAETQQSKKIIENALSNLSDELQKSAKNELYSMQHALQTAVAKHKEIQHLTFKQLKTSLKLPILISVLLTILTCLSIIVGTTLWLKIERDELITLRQTNKALKETQKTMSNWGISTTTYEGSRYIIFPKGTKLQQRDTTNGSIALRIVE